MLRKGSVGKVPENSGLEWGENKPVRMLQEKQRGPFAINGGLDTLRTFILYWLPRPMVQVIG
jgi:hypothetical protein